MTSDELNSQTFTIALLRMLMQSDPNIVSTDTLPKTTYCSNRQEMLSKILNPLTKLVATALGKELIFDCIDKGDHLLVCITSCNADIWFLERAGSRTK